MNELSTDRLATFVRRLFRIQQPNSPLPTLAIELQATYELGYHDREAGALLAGWELAGGGASVTAAAGNVGLVGLNNPVGSGKIAVLERVQLITGVAQVGLGFISTSNAFPLSVTACGRRDSRRALGAGLPPVFVGAAQNVGVIAFATNTFMQFTLSSSNLWQELGIVLLPGTAYYFTLNTLAATQGFNCLYKFRDLEPGEERGI